MLEPLMNVAKYKNLSSNCAILVNSCDAYEDVWELFFCALKDQWKDCDLEIYLNTEKKTYKFDGLRLNKVNNYAQLNLNKAWGGRLLETLKDIISPLNISRKGSK